MKIRARFWFRSGPKLTGRNSPPFGQAPGAGAAIALGAYNSLRQSILQPSPG